MAKNPYEAYHRLTQIAEGKRRWSDADAVNDDVGRKAAHDSVAGAYDWLRGNGYADMAAYMDTVGADEAARYAESKKPVTAYDPTVDARLVSEYLKPQWDAANAAGDQAGMATAAAQGQDAYARMTAGGYGDMATALQGMGSGAAQEYMRLLGGNYSPTVEGVQRKSNDAYATGKGYGRDLIDASDRVYRDLINVNPMATGYGRDVMRDYGAAADGMYDATLGAGIEAAGGNADSYGAAQANRNKSAVIQQGHADVRGFYDSLTGAGNTWYANRANALNGNFAGLQANVNADMAAQDAREARQNAIDLQAAGAYADLAKQEREIAANLELARISGDADARTAAINAAKSLAGEYISAGVQPPTWIMDAIRGGIGGATADGTTVSHTAPAGIYATAADGTPVYIGSDGDLYMMRDGRRMPVIPNAAGNLYVYDDAAGAAEKIDIPAPVQGTDTGAGWSPYGGGMTPGAPAGVPSDALGTPSSSSSTPRRTTNATNRSNSAANGTPGNSRSDTGESLLAWADEVPMGTIGNGRTPYANRRNEALKKGSPAEQDAEIQAVLDSNEYSAEYKKIVADDWFAQTGRRLGPRSYRDQFRANPYVSAAITDITKLPAYQNDRGNVYNYVEDLQRAGNVNDDEARYILNYFGIKA